LILVLVADRSTVQRQLLRELLECELEAVSQILAPDDIARLIKSKKPSDMETADVSRKVRSLA